MPSSRHHPDNACCDGRELVKEAEVRAAFLRSPLVELSAFAALHFLELLVGPKAAVLRVRDADKLGAWGLWGLPHDVAMVAGSQAALMRTAHAVMLLSKPC